MTPDSPNSGRPAPEQEVEDLALRIGRLLQGVEPDRREDLRELAYALIREEMVQGEVEEESAEGSSPRPFNPLGAGVLIFILGAGLSFLFGPVGLVLMMGGVMFVLWGAVISWVKG